MKQVIKEDEVEKRGNQHTLLQTEPLTRYVNFIIVFVKQGLKIFLHVFTKDSRYILTGRGYRVTWVGYV